MELTLSKTVTCTYCYRDYTKMFKIDNDTKDQLEEVFPASKEFVPEIWGLAEHPCTEDINDALQSIQLVCGDSHRMCPVKLFDLATFDFSLMTSLDVYHRLNQWEAITREILKKQKWWTSAPSALAWSFGYLFFCHMVLHQTKTTPDLISSYGTGTTDESITTVARIYECARECALDKRRFYGKDIKKLRWYCEYDQCLRVESSPYEFNTCGYCAVRYCSQTCSVMDWKEHNCQ